MRSLGTPTENKPENMRSMRETFITLWPYMWPKERLDLRRFVVICFILTAASKLITAINPFAFKWATDALAGNETPFSSYSDVASSEHIFIVGPAILIFIYGLGRVLISGFAQIRDALFSRVGQNAIRKLSHQVFIHMHNLSLRYHLERKTGGLSRVIDRGKSGIEVIVRMVMTNGLPTALEFALMVAILVFQFGLSYAAVAVMTVAVYLIFTIKVSERRIKIRREMNNSDNDANTKAIDSLLNYETVKYFNNEKMESERFDQSMKSYEDAAVRTFTSLSWLNFGQMVIFTAGLTFSLILISEEIGSGTKTVGDLVMLNIIFMQIWMPLNFIGFMYREIKQAMVDIESMFEILDKDLEVKDTPNAKKLEVSDGVIRFENIEFHYDKERPILKNVSFEIPKGHTVAIVGPSGAGKSTLSRLLYRFYDVQEGAVYIDDQDLRDVSQESLRKSIGMVPQDTVLFNDSVFYNIAYGRPSATREEVIEAAKLAQIHDFITSLPNGYDAMVGERGLKLSGGEKQRIAIARTILKAPPILVLDEATSALDSYTEKEIQDALERVSQGRTTMVVAHRLSTIITADNIIVMQNGEIVEQGTHNELLEKTGLYAGMWNQQKEADEAREKLLSHEKAGVIKSQ